MGTSRLWLRVCITVSVLCVGCGDDGTGVGDGATRDGGPRDSGGLPDAGMWMGGNPATDCPGRLDPVEHAGQVEVVGDGSAASCTEDALHGAVTILNGVEGGGTLTFDCGGEHTIASPTARMTRPLSIR